MVRLASYNIRKAVGLDWRRDPARILRVADDIGANVLALQEADKRLGRRPSALPMTLLSGAGWKPVTIGDGGSLGWHGNAILLGPGSRQLWTDVVDLPGLEPRGALIAGLDIGGSPLIVAAVHLGLLRRHRRMQLAAIAERLRRHPGPVALVGDFNEWSAASGLEGLTSEFDVHAPGHSFHAARPVAGLDRIAVRRGMRVEGRGVVDTPEARRASDHLPIWADIVLP
ncbi:endonuclease/exonuclease/phosphatase family protein [Jannaschia pohangensis]|uniref:endonuclease/exonuclease/phosphatase family protein n=1 Tax=Jannaschia pohangensis TaxID=390807 RepID=UPI001FE1C6AF|nr:endonuclease/exonuclease/phosphatase family protein [Jannaschia pohangensis]